VTLAYLGPMKPEASAALARVVNASGRKVTEEPDVSEVMLRRRRCLNQRILSLLFIRWIEEQCPPFWLAHR
jgi:hypothetical protein